MDQQAKSPASGFFLSVCLVCFFFLFNFDTKNLKLAKTTTFFLFRFSADNS